MGAEALTVPLQTTLMDIFENEVTNDEYRTGRPFTTENVANEIILIDRRTTAVEEFNFF